MNDKPYTSIADQSDERIEKMIGRYIRKVRQEQAKTQEELAQAAGISRSTLSLLERGSSGNLSTLIQVLRVLGRLSVLEALEYKDVLSPLALARAQHKEIERVRKPSKDAKPIDDQKSTW